MSITSATPMFEGDRHIPRAGTMISPTQNIGTEWTRT